MFKRSSHKMCFQVFISIQENLPSLPALPPHSQRHVHTHPHPCSPPCRCTLSKQSTVWLLGALHPQVSSSGSFSKHGFLPLSNSVGTLRNDFSKHALALQSWRTDDSWNALFFLSFFFYVFIPLTCLTCHLCWHKLWLWPWTCAREWSMSKDVFNIFYDQVR